MKRHTVLFGLCAVILLLPACFGTPIPVTRGLVRYVDVVGPEYRAYVEADESLTPEERKRRIATVEIGEQLADSVRADVGISR